MMNSMLSMKGSINIHKSSTAKCMYLFNFGMLLFSSVIYMYATVKVVIHYFVYWLNATVKICNQTSAEKNFRVGNM
jgi:hypothetical protein